MTNQESLGRCYEDVLSRAFGPPSLDEEIQGHRYMAFSRIQHLESGRGPTGGFTADGERDEVRRTLAEAIHTLIERGHPGLDVHAAQACLAHVRVAQTTHQLAELAIDAELLTRCFNDA